MYLRSSSKIHTHVYGKYIVHFILEMFGINRIRNLPGILITCTSSSDVYYNYRKRLKLNAVRIFLKRLGKLTTANFHFISPQFSIIFGMFILFILVFKIIFDACPHKIERLNSVVSSSIVLYFYHYNFSSVI